jgi:uncharacterized protein YndB with AHSA1/START domain
MSTPTTVKVSVSTVIKASPQAVFSLITDVTRMGEWSPETVAAQWVDGATGPKVGAKFKGTNRLGKAKWSTKPTITALEPARLFQFEVPGKSGPTWRYEFEAVDGGTRVTESVEQQRPSPFIIRMIQKRNGVTDRNESLRQGMITTLERLGHVAAAN